MSFDEKFAALVQRLPSLRGNLQTEEATKNALVMPFILALGYDIFNPKEVVPEFTADVGIKKGEKVDYAILNDEEIILLVECKKAGVDLRDAEMSQLFRYFSVTKARITILTNGIQYRFYSDLEEPNKMDQRPFLELDLEDPRPNLVKEVKKLAKDDFDLEEVLSTASELKYTSAIKKILAEQYESPDEDFCRYFFTQVNPRSRWIGTAKETFIPLVEKGLHQFISEKVSDRLLSALETEGEPSKGVQEDKPQVEISDDEDSGIVTTEEELQAFRIVQAIAAKVVDPERIAHRDAKTYMSVFFEDNNRKPICRFWFNTRQKHLGTFDANKQETKNSIESVADIYQYSEQIISAIQSYASQS
ncbi:type I restriction enzyme HsdR N-terminal domain-containing protein [Lusitaniella coriacea LEGE 07157]|uniref:Type I restriction enzyme HsdR N-terminal domain-containing protein n=1 Tax=Lusitaniella coriacea LEGE 07157 TaxID=945747 RepID=A0A8J7DXF5_9CYAN|nr:type I restriction endonuclease [Lusitaniella coriacea]MBE9117036.1 type I restriction enzyme HsdR N-terminal domain-containing protein [Lusitaniella coriacea LEGE 07157]